eukprot:5674981-Amphidinium_carterae.1
MPTDLGGLGIPFLPTLCCLAGYASLWQLQQPNDSGCFALYFADMDVPIILALLQQEHSFNLASLHIGTAAWAHTLPVARCNQLLSFATPLSNLEFAASYHFRLKAQTRSI